MYRGLARLAVRRRCERNTRPNGRHMMTAPLKHSEPITVGVALAERAYDIVIGRDELQSLGTRVATLRPGSRVAIVTDRNVAKHWLEKTEASLSEAGIATSRIIVDEGEGSKTYAGLEQVSEALISAKIERNDLVVALGGGVIGDLAGFAQSRSSIRPCAGGRHRLFRAAVPWRRRFHRHGAGGGIFRATRYDLRIRRGARQTSSCRGWSADPFAGYRGICPGRAQRCRRADGADGAGQEGQARPAYLHPVSGGRPRRDCGRCRAVPGSRFSPTQVGANSLSSLE